MDLKKLKIFLPIFLISILFIPKVSALTTTHNATLKYSDSLISTINDNQERINNLRTYITNLNCLYNNQYCINTGNYIMVITGSTMSTNTWQVRIVTTNATNDYINAWWRTSYSDGRLLMAGNGISFNFNFSGNNVTSHNNRIIGGFNYIDIWNTNGWSGNPMNNDIEIEINNYIDTYFLNENRQINFKTYGQTGFYDLPIDLNNIINIPTVNINAKELFDSLLPNTPIDLSCSLQPLGVVKNVSSFTYEVTGIGNALGEPLKGQFVFVGRGGTPLLTNDYNIQVKEKNNEDIDGRYEFQCNDEDIGNGCMLKYEYNYIDDIDTSLTLQFTFTSMTGQLDYEYSFYSCNVNNSKMNYTYIDNIGGNNQIVENPSLENSINDDNITESDNFLNDNIINNSAFNQDHGLTAIIQAPINFLQSLSSKTCSNIVLPIPHLGNATIPCMSSIYISKFNELYNILKIIINGVLCYRMALSVVMIVKGAKDPDNDKIEVMDL